MGGTAGRPIKKADSDNGSGTEGNERTVWAKVTKDQRATDIKKKSRIMVKQG